MIDMIFIFAELKRELITKRVKEGCRARGRLGGGPRINSEKVRETLALYRIEHYFVQEINNKTGVSKATLYRRLSELEGKNEINK